MQEVPQECPAQNFGSARGGQTERQQVRQAWEKVTQRTCDPQPLSNLMQVFIPPNPTPFSLQPHLACLLPLPFSFSYAACSPANPPRHPSRFIRNRAFRTRMRSHSVCCQHA
jgi:hypothetical protein